MSISIDEGGAFGGSVDRVYEELRSSIIMGRYLPGSPLRLQELSADLGVSLIPIREALRRLEVERLVESRQNRGARVAEMSLADVTDAYDTRKLLEAETLRRAWPNLDAAAIAEARATLDAMFTAFEEDRIEDGARLHRRYHFDLWAKAQSAWLDHLVRILWGHTERYRNLALVLQKPTRSHAEYHRLVLEAIEDGDLDVALCQTQEELERARAVVIEHLSEVLAPESEIQSA